MPLSPPKGPQPIARLPTTLPMTAVPGVQPVSGKASAPTLLRGQAVDVPQLSKPTYLGALVGPGSVQPPGLRFYGTDLGLTFEHAGKLFILFGDTWTSASAICETGQPQQDDTLGTIPLEYRGGVPQLAMATRSDAPTQLRNIHVYRGATSLKLGYGQAPMGGWSDGERSFAIFERLEPVRCDSAGRGCGDNSLTFCSSDLGLCKPDILSFPVPCDLNASNACLLPTQTCVPTSMCIDPTSSQFDDGYFGGKTASLAYETEVGVARDASVGDYDSILNWHTNKFSHPAVRTVAKWTGKHAGNDYQPGTDTLLVWGRPGFLAEQGRQAALYLMVHALPMELDEHGQWRFQPRYFTGIDPVSREPTWSEDEADAKPIALDGEVGGDDFEEVSVLGPVTVNWLPAPINQWIMLYGGDLADYLLSDPSAARGVHAPGSIVARFADHPWGPWSAPVVHLSPGSEQNIGDAYGPGGILYHPGCVDQPSAKCAKSDPHRPLDTALDGCPVQIPDPGRLYAPNIIDNYTRPNPDGGLDIVWNVSTWNPYGVQLLKTTLRRGHASAPADELADARGLARMSDWRALAVLQDEPPRYVQESSYDRGTTDFSFPLSKNGNRDFNNFICAAKDAVLPSAQVAPFEFDMPECPEDYVKGVVMGRFEGSGRMVRMWLGMQSLLTGPADDELLRLYVDDEPTPRVAVPLAAALDGRAGEIFAPPFGAGSPLRMAWYYPVAFQRKLIVTLDNLGEYDTYFYHCDVQLDRASSSAALPSERLPQRESARRELGAAFQPAGKLATLRSADVISLAAGADRAIVLDGPATIEELRLRYAESDRLRLARVRVRVAWDGAELPAIDLPLLDLFAANPTPPEKSTQALTSFVDAQDRVLALKLPMPFAKHASLVFSNTGILPVSFQVRIGGEARLPQGTLGRLHAELRETWGPTQANEHVAVDVSGRGRLVGVCGYVQGHADPLGGIQRDNLNMLEGDVRARIDGEGALNGTGTEEYTDDVFYFSDAPHARAFEAAWGVADDPDYPPGQASFCRWHVLGTELDFRQSLHLGFELGGAGNPSTVERFKTVAFYYRLD